MVHLNVIQEQKLWNTCKSIVEREKTILLANMHKWKLLKEGIHMLSLRDIKVPRWRSKVLLTYFPLSVRPKAKFKTKPNLDIITTSFFLSSFIFRFSFLYQTTETLSTQQPPRWQTQLRDDCPNPTRKSSTHLHPLHQEHQNWLSSKLYQQIATSSPTHPSKKGKKRDLRRWNMIKRKWKIWDGMTILTISPAL